MITVEQATKALQEIVAEYGEDYVYPGTENGTGCVYRDEYGQPSCLVGHVLSRLDPETFRDLTPRENFQPFDMINQVRKITSEDLKYALSIAQGRQDRGYTWGDAFKEFKGYLESRVISVD